MFSYIEISSSGAERLPRAEPYDSLSIRVNIHDMSHGWPQVLVPNPHWRWVTAIAVILTACSAHKDRPRASYVPLAELEAVYGPLITAGNHPTGDQSGTGDRLGLFRDAGGTIWGLPVAIMADGTVVGCAPPSVHDAPVTDSYPAVSTVIGCTNEPTGWRGGTGKLELLLRDAQGKIQWRAVNGSHIDAGPVCWAQDPPGPKQRLLYYRLAPMPRDK